MVYFIADTHFGDKNIINYENRPFSNVVDMDKAIINNWNSIVRDDDEIYLLGDVGTLPENINNILKGKKYLIKGNHDIHPNNYYREMGFTEVYDKPIIFNDFWILSHTPIYVCRNMPYANIFGHVHKSPLYKDYSAQHYCVTVERINYTPIAFDEIKSKILEENK